MYPQVANGTAVSCLLPTSAVKLSWKTVGGALIQAILALLVTVSTAVSANGDNSKQHPLIEDNGGAVKVPAFQMPPSSFLNLESRNALKEWTGLQDKVRRACPVDRFGSDSNIHELRKCMERNFYGPLVAKFRSRYNVQVRPRMIDGVYTEDIVPADGVSSRNKGRLLINLHGGGFKQGARLGGQMESIPIASVGKIAVVSIDYRMTPESKFPAATDDVVKVYRHLIKNNNPQSIGIYGCSAGALLTAQTIARLQMEGLPLPGAVGMFCAAGSYWSEGDSGYVAYALVGSPPLAVSSDPYFKDVNPDDPLVSPMRSNEVMAKFPPSLLISATRDIGLSSVVQTHRRLTQCGVNAELQVWEGIGHAFFFDPDLEESREMYNVTVRFFDRHLRPGGDVPQTTP